jgi:hypothetical protein
VLAACGIVALSVIAHVSQRVETILHRPCADGLGVVVRPGVDVVVVVFESGVGEAARLILCQHAQRHAGFKS